MLIAGGAAAGAALVAGVVFTALANERTSNAAQKHDALAKAGGQNACAARQFAADCKVLFGLRQDARAFTAVAASTFVVAGLVGAATAIYALATRRNASSDVQVASMLAAQAGGVWLTGHW